MPYTSRSAFWEDASCYLSMLHASTAHFKKNEFDVEILHSFAVEDTAKLLRQIGDCTRAQSTVWDKQEWTRRKWLTNEASAVSKLTIYSINFQVFDWSMTNAKKIGYRVQIEVIQ